MSYFDHPYLSNSDIKDFKKKIGLMPEDPENLQEIFDLGTLIHAVIVEPHKADIEHKDLDMAMTMRKSFYSDQFLRDFVACKDFVGEKPYFSKEVKVGPFVVNLRCKMDGVRESIKAVLELKGLKVSNFHDFRVALERYNYDQAIAHYMLTGGMERAIIVGLSKTKPDMRPMKWIVKKHDEFYAAGEQKLIDDLTLIETYSPDDVKRV